MSVVSVGTFAYATDQGLGILAKSFVDHGVVQHVLRVNHSHHVNHPEWYPDAPSTPGRPFNAAIAREFVRKQTAMLFFETPFDWSLVSYCREQGIPTFLMPMYECMPDPLPVLPDWIINPSHLDQQVFPEHSVHIPIPVEVPWRERTTARVFVHNAGHLGLRGRNGTLELLQAMEHVQSPEIKLIVRAQTNEVREVLDAVPSAERDPRIDIRIGSVPWEILWDEGDVFVFPEKFNGLSLPLQEAHAAGMLVIASNRFPMNEWLPNEPLIPVESYHTAKVFGGRVPFQEAVINPRDIARTLDTWYGQDITYYSHLGREFAQEMSWDALKPRYLETLQRGLRTL